MKNEAITPENINKILKIFYFLPALFLAVYCNGENSYTPIEIVFPLNNQVFSNGEIIKINAKIYDDGDTIMNEELLVTNIQNQDTIISFKDNKFVFEYELNKEFIAHSNEEYKIEVKARGGHGNWASKTVLVKCN